MLHIQLWRDLKVPAPWKVFSILTNWVTISILKELVIIYLVCGVLSNFVMYSGT
jgi:hypothetical protein